MHRETELKWALTYIADNRDSGISPSDIANVFDHLIWCMYLESGIVLHNLRRNWLSGDDRYKVEIALEIRETFPYSTRDEMVISFNRIIEKWPNLKNKCTKIIDDWDKKVRKV